MNKFIKYARIACRKAGYPFDLREWVAEWSRLSPADRRYYRTAAAWN